MHRSDRETVVGPPAGRLAAATLRTRWLVRLPIWLYRVGLGRVVGRRLMCIEHVGRVTGARRRVVLEVVGRTPDGAPLVVSGFGTTSQWYRNLMAQPRVRIWWGTKTARSAVARRVDPDRARRHVATYAGRHPFAWSRLAAGLSRINGRLVDIETFDLPVLALEVDRVA